MCDIADFPGAELGHAWVVAPPFVIVDGTIRLQNPEGDPMNAFTPPIVAVEDAPLIKPTVDDVVSAQLRARIAQDEGRLDSQLHHRLVPELEGFSREFPSREVRFGDLALRYVPAACGFSDVGLEDINGAADKLTGAEVWNDHVVPAFSAYVVSGYSFMGDPLTEGNFLNLTEAELDQHVYRIMRESYVIQSVHRPENVLSQVHNWKDKFENFQLKLGGILDDEPFEYGFRDDFVGQCWTRESCRKRCGAFTPTIRPSALSGSARRRASSWPPSSPRIRRSRRTTASSARSV